MLNLSSLWHLLFSSWVERTKLRVAMTPLCEMVLLRSTLWDLLELAQINPNHQHHCISYLWCTDYMPGSQGLEVTLFNPHSAVIRQDYPILPIRKHRLMEIR